MIAIYEGGPGNLDEALNVLHANRWATQRGTQISVAANTITHAMADRIIDLGLAREQDGYLALTRKGLKRVSDLVHDKATGDE